MSIPFSQFVSLSSQRFNNSSSKESSLLLCFSINIFACGSASLIKGVAVDMAGGGVTHFRLSDVPKWKSIFYKGIREVHAYGCVDCQHLQFAVDFSQEDLQRYRQFEGEQPSVLERINAETDESAG
jgi:hypothetical protein